MRIPIYFEGNISADEIEAVFSQAGYMVKSEGGVLVAMRVPAFLRKDTATNVVPMARVRKAR